MGTAKPRQKAYMHAILNRALASIVKDKAARMPKPYMKGLDQRMESNAMSGSGSVENSPNVLAKNSATVAKKIAHTECVRTNASSIFDALLAPCMIPMSAMLLPRSVQELPCANAK
mmetsp:Transcript_62161/g.110930  ORF Transcript_62161/g.110930 Transcript_62161/m.110930 type:complete len:116 (-) Transcript_62161:42-389(-)